MKTQQTDRLFTKQGVLIGAVLFAIYAVILLSLDPEWVLWAGSMTLGALYIPDPAPSLFDHPQEALQMASVFNLLGLLTLLLLMVIIGEVHSGWLSWLRVRWGEQWSSRHVDLRP